MGGWNGEGKCPRSLRSLPSQFATGSSVETAFLNEHTTFNDQGSTKSASTLGRSKNEADGRLNILHLCPLSVKRVQSERSAVTRTQIV